MNLLIILVIILFLFIISNKEKFSSSDNRKPKHGYEHHNRKYENPYYINTWDYYPKQYYSHPLEYMNPLQGLI